MGMARIMREASVDRRRRRDAGGSSVDTAVEFEVSIGAQCVPRCGAAGIRTRSPLRLYCVPDRHSPTRIAMMYRICLCLLVVAASGNVAARDVKMGSPNGGSCPDSAADREPVRASARKALPARETKANPTLPGDVLGSGRLQSPRWHSFLPGMFR